MRLDQKYDQMYGAATTLGEDVDLALRSWPRDRVTAILKDAPPARCVLDVGCGDGRLLLCLRDRFREFVGLEYSRSRLDQACANLASLPFRPVLGSAEDMSEIAAQSIDVIVSADVIEHVPDVYRAAGEMHRVLKPGGVAVINTPNIAFIKKRLLLAMGRFPSTSQPNEGLGSDILFDGGHLHYFTFRSLSLLLAKAGLEIVRHTGFGALGRASRIWPGLLSSGVQVVARRAA
jgi:SAM-dependent methyltransferase